MPSLSEFPHFGGGGSTRGVASDGGGRVGSSSGGGSTSVGMHFSLDDDVTVERLAYQRPGPYLTCSVLSFVIFMTFEVSCVVLVPIPLLAYGIHLLAAGNLVFGLATLLSSLLMSLVGCVTGCLAFACVGTCSFLLYDNNYLRVELFLSELGSWLLDAPYVRDMDMAARLKGYMDVRAQAVSIHRTAGRFESALKSVPDPTSYPTTESTFRSSTQSDHEDEETHTYTHTHAPHHDHAHAHQDAAISTPHHHPSVSAGYSSHGVAGRLSAASSSEEIWTRPGPIEFTHPT